MGTVNTIKNHPYNSFSTPAAFISSILLFVGSGGNTLVLPTVDATPPALNKTLNQQELSQTPISSTTVNQQIRFIKDAFDLRLAEIANILEVERATLNNWKNNNSIPKDHSRKKFQDLYLLAKDWRSFGFPSDRATLHSHTIMQKSIHDVLPSLDREKILFMGRSLLRQSDNDNSLI